jgi:hypothetical protein
MLNLRISEVAYATSNLTKIIIQMQQAIIDLYLARLFSVHKGESSGGSIFNKDTSQNTLSACIHNDISSHWLV